MASGGVACFRRPALDDLADLLVARLWRLDGGQLDRRLVGLGDAQVEARQIVRRRRARPRLQQRAQVVALEAAAAEPERIGADAGVVALVVETGQLVDDERRRPQPRHGLEIVDDAAAPVEGGAGLALGGAAGAQPARDLVIARAHGAVAGGERHLEHERDDHLLVGAALAEGALDAQGAVAQRLVADLARELLGIPQRGRLLELLVGLLEVAAIDALLELLHEPRLQRLPTGGALVGVERNGVVLAARAVVVVFAVERLHRAGRGDRRR